MYACTASPTQSCKPADSTGTQESLGSCSRTSVQHQVPTNQEVWGEGVGGVGGVVYTLRTQNWMCGEGTDSCLNSQQVYIHCGLWRHTTSLFRVTHSCHDETIMMSMLKIKLSLQIISTPTPTNTHTTISLMWIQLTQKYWILKMFHFLPPSKMALPTDIIQAQETNDSILSIFYFIWQMCVHLKTNFNILLQQWFMS